MENIDLIIELIKSSKDSNDAKNKLTSQNWKIPSDNFIKDFINSDNEGLIETGSFKITDTQAKAILEIKLSRLTGLERSKLVNDLKECVNLINNFLKILSSKDKLNEVIIEELHQIKEKNRIFHDKLRYQRVKKPLMTNHLSGPRMLLLP